MKNELLLNDTIKSLHKPDDFADEDFISEGLERFDRQYETNPDCSTRAGQLAFLSECLVQTRDRWLEKDEAEEPDPIHSAFNQANDIVESDME